MFRASSSSMNNLFKKLGTGQVGKTAEDFAKEYFIKMGYKILTQNFRSRYGEIDLIVQKKQGITFVEVKFRSSFDFGLPQEFVIKRKQAKIRKTATKYLVEKNLWNKVDCHFDVISVYEEKGKLALEHIKDAF